MLVRPVGGSETRSQIGVERQRAEGRREIEIERGRDRETDRETDRVPFWSIRVAWCCSILGIDDFELDSRRQQRLEHDLFNFHIISEEVAAEIRLYKSGGM